MTDIPAHSMFHDEYLLQIENNVVIGLYYQHGLSRTHAESPTVIYSQVNKGKTWSKLHRLLLHLHILGTKLEKAVIFQQI